MTELPQPQFKYGEYPPNHEAICKVFPAAKGAGTIFAYDGAIYVPSGKPLTHWLIEHENVHLLRQRQDGADKWWENYLSDPKFRYYEELLAHTAEYAAIAKGRPRKDRRNFLDIAAQRLSAPLYAYNVTKAKAKADIQHMMETINIDLEGDTANAIARPVTEH